MDDRCKKDEISGSEEMPLDLKLDLLVDEELPEEDRRSVLLSLDKEPRRWRDLSIRFLQRQVEKRALRQLFSRKSSEEQPVAVAGSEHYKFTSWLTNGRYMAIAAGLIIAVTSAMLTVHFMSQRTDISSGTGVANTDVMLPGSLTDSSGETKVTIPVTEAPASLEKAVTFPEDSQVARRSFVIKPEGNGKAVVVPVTNLQFQ